MTSPSGATVTPSNWVPEVSWTTPVPPHVGSRAPGAAASAVPAPRAPRTTLTSRARPARPRRVLTAGPSLALDGDSLADHPGRMGRGRGARQLQGQARLALLGQGLELRLAQPEHERPAPG